MALVASKLAQVATFAGRLAKDGAALGLSPADNARLGLNIGGPGETLAAWLPGIGNAKPTHAYAKPRQA